MWRYLLFCVNNAGVSCASFKDAEKTRPGAALEGSLAALSLVFRGPTRWGGDLGQAEG